MDVLIAPVTAAGVDSEELAARFLGGGHYVIESVPVVAGDVALGDIVSCVTVNGRRHIDRVVIAGGNTTLRILVEGPHAGSISAQLVALECPVVEAFPGMFAVSISLDAPGEGIREWLSGLAEQGLVQVAGTA